MFPQIVLETLHQCFALILPLLFSTFMLQYRRIQPIRIFTALKQCHLTVQCMTHVVVVPLHLVSRLLLVYLMATYSYDKSLPEIIARGRVLLTLFYKNGETLSIVVKHRLLRNQQISMCCTRTKHCRMTSLGYIFVTVYD